MARNKKIRIDTEERRTALFLQVLGCLWRYSDIEKKAVAEEAGCHWTTLYNWCAGKTTHPRIDTLTKVAAALGFEIVLKRTLPSSKPRRKLRVVK
jgi:DNA-binding phage protein